jgi:hypothetical protein
MTIVALGVFGVILLGLALLLAGALARSRSVLVLGGAALLVGVALYAGIATVCYDAC